MNTTKQGRTKALIEKAEFELANHERLIQEGLDAFVEAVVKMRDIAGGYGLGSLIVSDAERVFRAEQVKRWQKAIRECLRPERPELDLEGLLEEIEGSLERWTPNRSTWLIYRAQGEAELEALRVARQLVRSLLKANGS